MQYWGITLRGKDITIPLRANPKQANPPLLELPREVDLQASIAVETIQRNVQLNAGDWRRVLIRDWSKNWSWSTHGLLRPFMIFSGKSDIPQNAFTINSKSHNLYALSSSMRKDVLSENVKRFVKTRIFTSLRIRKFEISCCEGIAVTS